MADPQPASRRDGVLGFFVRHRTAANLVMLIMFLAGYVGLSRMNTQFFPDFSIDMVMISVPWAGASAADVDANIIEPIDREVRFLDGVKKVISTSREGMASVLVEFYRGTDMQAALGDVETAVDQVTTLPKDAEEPEIQRIVHYDSIARLILTGPVDEATLKRTAKDIRDDLIRRGIDKVDFSGSRDEEITVDVPPELLRELDLTVGDIAQQIEWSTQDLPSGDTPTAIERQIRSLGEIETAAEAGEIEIIARANGERVLLKDIATVSDAFRSEDNTVWTQRQQGIELYVQRATTADALKTAAILDDAVEEIRPTLPPGVSLTVYDEAANLIESRIALLVNNGISGLIIVLLVLVIFLNFNVAFWVAVGIPTALAGAMGIMLLTGQSINMISLFAMILVLGIVVDDAIVVGEHAEMQRRRGLSGMDAAILGAQRMAAPVTASILTTIAAFLPMFVVGDIIGAVIRAIPLVVVAALLCSMIECFFVLPGHLKHALRGDPDKMLRIRAAFNHRFDAFRDGPFRRLVRLGLRRRYSTIASALALLCLSIGLIAGGRVGFTFFPTPEVDTIFANVKLVAGHDRHFMQQTLRRIEAAAYAAEDDISPDDPLVDITVAVVGQQLGTSGPSGLSQGDSYGSVFLELTPSETRDIRTPEFMRAWRARIPDIPGIESLSVTPAQGGPPGREVDIRLFGGQTDVLKRAAQEVLALANSIPGVSELEDNLQYGKEEIILKITPQGRAMGFTTESVGRQVRDAFKGATAKKFARGDEEVEIIVRLDEGALGRMALEDLYLRGSTGVEAPLGEIVTMGNARGFSAIRRENGSREVAITGEVDENVVSGGEVLEALDADIQSVARKHGLNVRYAGKAEEQAQTMGDMQIGAVIGLALIYIILAWVFGSYWLPVAVMSIIPFGMIGVGFGHWLMGYDLTFLSLVGMLGLSGILVNDSIVLISTIDRRRKEISDLLDAIEQGTCERLRAVLLTSLTTIGGLTPLMFETSVQAQFLIPMAITIVFGLGLATFLVLLVVPALVAIGADAGSAAGRLHRMARGTNRSARATAE